MLTLAAADYHDPAVHERERARVFGREWLCLGPAASVAEPGAYLAERVAGWPVLVVRDDEGALRAFHNVCRHRAGPLVEDGTGTCRVLVCAYHGWSYDLDGSLRAARDSGLDDDALAGTGLFEVAVDVWRGLLFVWLGTAVAGGPDRAPTPPPLEAWLGEGFIEACAPYPMESWAPVERLEHGLACNWKTYGDNYLEGYHIPLVHRALAQAIDPSSYRVDVHDGWAQHRARTRDGATATGAWLWHWPNLALNLYEHGMSVERWEPTGATTCRLVLDFCFADTDDAGRERNRLDVEASRVICEEDQRICEQVQRNLEAGVYDRGLLSPRHEAGVVDFHRRVRAARGDVP